MSGITAATAIALGSLAVGAVGTGVGIYSGMQSADKQKKSLQNQTTATQQAESAALSTQRKNETATNAANMKTPNITDIMARAAQAGKGGVGSTMLTGSGGVDTSSLNLGKSSLLGG